MNETCRCVACLPLSVFRCYRLGGQLWIASVCCAVLSFALWSALAAAAALLTFVLGAVPALFGLLLEKRAERRS